MKLAETSIKSEVSRLKTKIKNLRDNYNGLSGKDSSYAREHELLIETYGKVIEVYERAISNGPKWIYRYLIPNREEIDIGPYDTKKEADAAMKVHASFGALTEGPIKVDKDYKLFKGE